MSALYIALQCKSTFFFDGNQIVVSFLARRAAGAGYEGAVRHYSLQAATDLAGPWTTVPGFSDLVGNDQTVTFQTAFPNVPMFFRGQVWLYSP